MLVLVYHLAKRRVGYRLAEFTTLDQKKAPSKPVPRSRTLAARMREYDGYVLAVKKGQAERFILSAGETPRSIMRRLQGAGHRTSKNVSAWQHDGFVYFTVR